MRDSLCTWKKDTTNVQPELRTQVVSLTEAGVIRYKINGKYVTREQWDAKKGVGLHGKAPLGTVAYSQSKPLISDGIGCMKSQVPEMRETIRRHNIKGVYVRDNGQLEITSRQGRRELLRVRGLNDADGGYGDG